MTAGHFVPSIDDHEVNMRTLFDDLEGPARPAELPDFVPLMRQCRDADDGRDVIRAHETAFHAAEEAAGLAPLVGKQIWGYRGFSTLRPQERKQLAKKSPLLKSLIEQGDQLDQIFAGLIDRERQQSQCQLHIASPTEDEPTDDEGLGSADDDDEVDEPPARVEIHGQLFMRDGIGNYTNIEDADDGRMFEYDPETREFRQLPDAD
jgi:hypothetical protein